MGARELELLRFAAEQRVLVTDQAAAWLGGARSTAGASLRALEENGLISRHRIFRGQGSAFTITGPGLRLLGERLAAPRVDLGTFTHDVGVGWLWIAAHRGAFGPVQQVISERRVRSGDNAVSASGPEGGVTLAVRLGGTGPGGRRRLHYPDLILVTADGRRIAVELELTDKGRPRRETILRGYMGEPRFAAVLYLVERERLGRAIGDSARRMGMSDIVAVHRVGWAGRRPGLESDVRQEVRPTERSAAGGRPVRAPASQRALEVARAAGPDSATTGREP